jgi:Arc/MetJ family transcription regulator
MHICLNFYARMPKRTTVEIDEKLLAKAKRVLGVKTTRETIEESLRRAVAQEETQEAERAPKQSEYLKELSHLVDIDVLRSDGMWR